MATAMADLETWLDEATKGLCAHAREQVRAEVWARYAALRKSALAEDVAEPAASVQAIALLGNPAEARRAYRKVHLTDRDASDLIRFIDLFSPAASPAARLRWNIGTSLFAALMVVFAAWFWFAMHPAAGVNWALASAAALYSRLQLVPRLVRAGRVTEAAGWSAIVPSVLTAAGFLCVYFVAAAKTALAGALSEQPDAPTVCWLCWISLAAIPLQGGLFWSYCGGRLWYRLVRTGWDRPDRDI